MSTTRLLPLIPLALRAVAAAAIGFQTPAIAPEELGALLGGPEGPVVIDLRDPAEYRVAHVPGAINVPEPELADRLGTLNPHQGVILYCIAGKRTRSAEQTLGDRGFGHVRHLEGGFTGWLDVGLPIRKGPAP